MADQERVDEGMSSESENYQERRRRRYSPFVEEEDMVVGRDADVKALVARLIEGTQQRSVISIVGIGGSGKTTLAKEVYNNYEVKRHFDSRYWVVVSRKQEEHGGKELLQRVAEKILGLAKEDSNKMKKEELEEKLRQFLRGKKFLVVLDDLLWQNQAWHDVEAAFPDVKNGSRVLVTTRSGDGDPEWSPHVLRFLDDEESWELFLKNGGPCPPELEELGKQIVAKAGGLPLAILALGGLLQKRVKTPRAWLELLEKANWEVGGEDRKQIAEILALSYSDLHNSMKQCFLYFGVFPEDDFEIHAETLIQVWVAEGFIPEKGAKTMEEVAEDYLEELGDRNLVQIVKRSPNGKIEKCLMHDLLKDLAILEAKNCDFLCILANNASEAPNTTCRIAVHDDTIIYSALNHTNPTLRGFLWLAPNSSATLSEFQCKSISTSFKLLKVLFMFGPNISTFPDEIGELIHLTYLEWWADFSKEGIPSSIGNLHKLQTLCLSSSKPFYLPSVIWNLPDLRFLWCGRQSHAIIKGRPTEVASVNLHTLSKIEIGPWIEDCLGKFTCLRRLNMCGDFPRFGNAVQDFIVNSKSLRILKLDGGRDGIKALVPLSQHLHLHQMVLSGSLEKIPDAHEFPPNLTELTLVGTEFERDPLPILEKLPSLTFLELIGKSYAGEKMVCSASGFPRLRELTLNGLPKLREWKVEQGAMPNLKRLVVVGCHQLEEVPEGLQHVTTLRELELIAMPVEFRNRVVDNDGEDWYKIRHIPSLFL
eukprot:TRINITY_DN10246_c0_g1_i3.p1 TRINITY_DN10246_c0_g1~~TRINITY_DN10246_c0_g1_i3.p1  ORF type:complete len:762 (+),score=108.97 TRINITY_DN10246_c0_g1_i3:153-2438(+)